MEPDATVAAVDAAGARKRGPERDRGRVDARRARRRCASASSAARASSSRRFAASATARVGNGAERRPRAARGGGRRARARARERRARPRARRTRRSTSPSPARRCRVGHLHPITQIRRHVEDAFLGLGYQVRYDREVETTEYNFDKLAFPPWHPARSPRDTLLLRRRRAPADGDVPVADPRARGARAADLHGLDRPLLPPRRDRRDALPDLPPVRGPRRRPRASRSPT